MSPRWTRCREPQRGALARRRTPAAGSSTRLRMSARAARQASPPTSSGVCAGVALGRRGAGSAFEKSGGVDDPRAFGVVPLAHARDNMSARMAGRALARSTRTYGRPSTLANADCSLVRARCCSGRRSEAGAGPTPTSWPTTRERPCRFRAGPPLKIAQRPLMPLQPSGYRFGTVCCIRSLVPC